MMRRVGILGGMGPEATILVMQKVLAAVEAHDDADHVPLIVDQNPQVPSRIQHLIEGTGTDPGPVLAAMAQRLEAGGAEALAMPCNTAHHFAQAIRAAVGIPFLDMIELSADRAQTLAGHDSLVGILASPAVRKVGLFDEPLSRRSLKPVYPDEEVGMKLLSAIRLVKAKGPCPEARDILLEASRQLASQGAGVQMIACTEFSLMADAAQAANVFDTLDCLVAAIVRFAGARPVTDIHDLP